MQRKRHHDRGASAEDALLLVAVNTLLVVVDALLVTVGATVSIVDSGSMVVAEAYNGGRADGAAVTLGTLDPGGMIDGQQKLVVSGQPMNNGMDATAIV